MSINTLIDNDATVSALQHAVRDGSSGIENVPGLLSLVLKEEKWRERQIRYTGDYVQFEKLEDFIRATLPDGLGSEPETVRKLVTGYPEVLTMLDRVLEAKSLADWGEVGNGRSRGSDTTSTHEDRGSSYLLGRIARDCPEVHEQFRAGAYRSVFDAAKAAGIVPARMSVPRDVPALANSLRRKLAIDERAELARLLTEDA